MPSIDVVPNIFVDRATSGQVQKALPTFSIEAVNIGGIISPLASPDWQFIQVVALAAAAVQTLISNGAGTHLNVLGLIIKSTVAGILTFQVGASNKFRINTVLGVDYLIFPPRSSVISIGPSQNFNVKNDGGVALTFDVSILYCQPTLV